HPSLYVELVIDACTLVSRQHCLFFFFFNDTATTEIYTLSLHDALPISAHGSKDRRGPTPAAMRCSWAALRAERQRQLEHSAMGNVLCRRKPAAVRLDDRTADRQADAEAVGLGGVERLEQAFGVLAREPRSSVAHLD